MGILAGEPPQPVKESRPGQACRKALWRNLAAPPWNMLLFQRDTPAAEAHANSTISPGRPKPRPGRPPCAVDVYH